MVDVLNPDSPIHYDSPTLSNRPGAIIIPPWRQCGRARAVGGNRKPVAVPPGGKAPSFACWFSFTHQLVISLIKPGKASELSITKPA
jgi:hypothetical protein